MRQLIEGIKIIGSSNNLILKDRIFLSSGTQFASVNTQQASLPYCCDAIIPALPWRIPTVLERQILFSSKIEKLSNSYVTLLKIPKNILSNFYELTMVGNPSILDIALKKDQVRRGISLIHNYIKIFRSQHADISKYGIGYNLPNQMTVTIGANNCKVGLHIDNQRNLLPHRILINLGSEPRYFLFINLSIQQLYTLIKKNDANLVTETSGRSRICMVFMQLFPNYPVVKLKVNPGEAYIAPTEDITHDGCTEGTNSLGIFFTLRTIFD